jgi:hypothetical protein
MDNTTCWEGEEERSYGYRRMTVRLERVKDVVGEKRIAPARSAQRWTDLSLSDVAVKVPSV